MGRSHTIVSRITAKVCAVFSYLVCLLAGSALSQVAVRVTTDKVDYLTGEPVFAIVNITNVGSEPIAYSGCDGEADLTVTGAEKQSRPISGVVLPVWEGAEGAESTTRR